MKELINRKSGVIGKLFIYQIAMSLFGLFVISPFSGRMQIVASLFATLFYFSLVCYAIIEDGQKDYVSFSAGRLEDGKATDGFVYALISYIPTIVIVLLNVILNLANVSVDTLKSLLGIVIRFFLMGMYLGFDTGLVVRTANPVTFQMEIAEGEKFLFLSDNYLIFAICLIFLPVVCGVCYNLAFNGKIHVDTTPKEKKNKK